MRFIEYFARVIGKTFVKVSRLDYWDRLKHRLLIKARVLSGKGLEVGERYKENRKRSVVFGSVCFFTFLSRAHSCARRRTHV